MFLTMTNQKNRSAINPVQRTLPPVEAGFVGKKKEQ